MVDGRHEEGPLWDLPNRPPVAVRKARRGDAAADLVFASTPELFSWLAGSPERARMLVARQWSTRGHSVSYYCAWVAECAGEIVGVLMAFPARQRLRRQAMLALRTVWRLPPTQWLALTGALIKLVRLTPPPPGDSYYVGALALTEAYRRRGVASAMGRVIERHAGQAGFARLATLTGVRHLPARAALAEFGCRGVAQRQEGYVLYVKDLPT